MSTKNASPALHNAMWPGLVGKGPDSEPPISLETMLDLTCGASVNGVKFDGVDLFLCLPHTDIDSSDEDLKKLADDIGGRGLRVGSMVAPVWGPTGGGSAMGDDEEQAKFLTQVRKACRIGKKLKDLGVRKYGVVRIDSATGPHDWLANPEAGTRRIADTFTKACNTSFQVCWFNITSLENMQPSQQMCCTARVRLPASSRNQAPESRTISKRPFGSKGWQWRPVLSWEPEPFTVPSFWATWKSIIHGRNARAMVR